MQQGGPSGERGGEIIGRRIVATNSRQGVEQVVEVRSGEVSSSNAFADTRMDRLARILAHRGMFDRVWVEDVTPETQSMRARNIRAGLAPSGLPLNHNRSD